LQKLYSCLFILGLMATYQNF